MAKDLNTRDMDSKWELEKMFKTVTFRENKITITMRHYYVSIRMAKDNHLLFKNKISNRTKMWSNWNSHIWMMEIQNCAAILEKSMAGAYSVHHPLNLQRRNSIPRYLSKRNESKYPHKDFYSSVHSSFVYNRPKLEMTIRSPTGEWKNNLR